MKQHITEEDIQQLTPEQRSALHARFNNPFLTIGQMIEFLEQEGFSLTDFGTAWSVGSVTFGAHHWDFVDKYNATELCDALWQAVQDELKT